MEIRAERRQVGILSPRLQRAVRLLQMSSLDFAALMRDTATQNPFLESDEADDGGPEVSDDTRAEPVPSAADGDDDRALWQGDAGGGARRDDDDGLSATDTRAIDTTLSAHLHGQLNLLPLPWRDLVLARALVESLDDDGYLRTPLEELRALLTLDPPVSPSEMRIALRRVQSLDPSGIGARSVAECLLLQLHGIDCPDQRALAERIVRDHLPALADHDVAGLARWLQVSPERVQVVCERIRRLDPRPGWRLGASQIGYVVPDVVARKVGGQWVAQLNPAVVPKLRLNQVYAQLFKRHRTAGNGALGQQLQEAKWTLSNVEQRFATILDVASAIVRRQRNFLEYGEMAMRPLALREIADDVGVHESTVCRVTNNKYLATCSGVFELKYFFSRAMTGRNGNACSGIAIRGLIKGLIGAERPGQPLSDADITRALSQQGLAVARRTVAKYRQMLKIEAADRRQAAR